MSRIMATLGVLGEYPWGNQLPEMLATGLVGAVRINVTRWNIDQIRGAVEVVRKLSPETKILIDLGQKLCVRTADDKKVYFDHVGQKFELLLYPDEDLLSLRWDMRGTAFKQDDPVIMRDGKMQGRIVWSDHARVEIELTHIEPDEGYLNRFSGITFPQTAIKRCIYGPRELEIIDLARQLRVDMLASSFTESAQDAQNLSVMTDGTNIIPVPKIESTLGFNNLDQIIDSLPRGRKMIMFARGDMFVEARPELLALYQRRVAQQCKMSDCSLIVATGLLRSMRTLPEPSRAEVIDADTSARSGATYLMTAEETNNSLHPTKVVEMLGRIIDNARK